MKSKAVPFLAMFPCCRDMDSMCGGLQLALVSEAKISRKHMELRLQVWFSKCPVKQEILHLCQCIAQDFGLKKVDILPDYPKEVIKPSDKKGEGNVLYGTAVKGTPIPMAELTQESGRVVVEGEVFFVGSREVKNGAKVLSFDMTDYTNSVRVSKYIRPEDDSQIVGMIKKGMYLKVKGTVGYNRYDEDISLEPTSIMTAAKPQRQDTAEEKRVELHLHTRMSMLDALTDPAKAVETAARWGHPAIAITDHGVLQSFPEVWKAKKGKDIKILYGVEGYYQNDVDGRLGVYAPDAAPIDGPYVAFDIETTGLDPEQEEMTEIGAVLMHEGKVLEKFETFVNPGKPIPYKITELTGIRDEDVKDAPSPRVAMEAFLAFAQNYPLVAHNASFDIGFMSALCEREGLHFAPRVIDTLTLSQCLMTQMRRHKLNLVAAALGLPDFRHHRASDDAMTCGRILERLIEKLKEQQVHTLLDLGEFCAKHQKGVRAGRMRHIIILAKNKIGLKNLYTLVSKSHLEFFKKNPIIPKSLLQQYREGLIIGSACEAGEVFEAVLSKKSRRDLHRIASFYDYLEIQPICNNEFLVRDGKVADREGLRDLNRRIVDLGHELGKPVVATGDVHFLEPEQEILRRVLLAAKGFSDCDSDLPIYFKTTDEMLEEFSYLGKEKAHEVVIKNPNQIAAQCEDIMLFPKELFAPKIKNSAEELTRLVYERMRALYGENPPEIVKKRVETELSDIINCKYDVIYMSAQKLVQNSLEAGYLVGSRGSVGSSIVAYMSGITEVNSLPAHYRCEQCQHTDFASGQDYGCGADMPDANCPVCGAKLQKDGFDIPFETFLGFNGDKIPDIDLNFSGEYQARAHKYTEELFGRENVYRAGTIGTLAQKTAYGYVKNYLNERNKVVTKAEENRLTEGLVGVKRSTGQHPGGLVIIPQDKDVTDFCPVQHPADSAESGIITTHFDYHAMEDNLLKLDELGHDDPTMIKMLEDMTGVNAREISLDDPETMAIFQSPAPLGILEEDAVIGQTGTIGIPEFGTGFTRGMLVDTKPERFDTLVRLSGFSHGTDVWLGNAKDLILSGTADINQTVGCRDDIMLYLIQKGMDEKQAFKIMEAVRKGRGLTPEWVQEMQKLEVPAWYIESLQKIKYLFPKAHAVAYVMMAFRIAWFKVHKPLAYYSAYFYRRADSFDAELMIQGIGPVRAKLSEIRKLEKPTAKEQDLYTTLEAVYEFYMRGFCFAPMDLYASDAVKFLICEENAGEAKQLRPPFLAISGLGETAARDLVASREGRSFISIEEVMAACTKVSQTHMEQLRKLGALGNLPETSQMSLF